MRDARARQGEVIRIFLSRQKRTEEPEGLALTGPVTVPGDPAGAWLEGERRAAAVYAPGGYHWLPAEGQEVLVLKAGACGEKRCAVGIPQSAEKLELQPGEVAVTAGKAALRLKPDGTVELTGTLRVNGTVVGPEPALEKGV